MALQQRQGQPKEESIDLVEDIREHWRQPKLLLSRFQTWVTQQPIAVEALVATLAGSGQGALLGGVMGSITKMDPSSTNQLLNQPGSNPDMVKQMQAFQQGGPWVQARNFAVLTGVGAGLTVALKRIRGKEDVYSTMASAFGSGVAFSLVSGMAAGNKFQGAFTTGTLFALFQGAFYQIGKKFNRGNATEELPEYARATHLLATLGFQKYQKNLRAGQLNDATLMLWNDSALREVKIPPGPRLLIMHHLERYRHVLKPGMPLPTPPPLPPQQQSQGQVPLRR
ncbi:g11591 [Coccomyxa elongata]